MWLRESNSISNPLLFKFLKEKMKGNFMCEKKLLAHLEPDSNRKQLLSSHSENAAALCSQYGKKIGMKNLGRFIGLLHDSGKGTRCFQDYLKSGDLSRRGQIPHAFCGARYCFETWGMDGTMEGLTAEFAAAAICAHHSGLPDVTGVQAEDNLHRRAWPEKPVSYEEARDGFFQCFSRQKLDGLFDQSRQEVSRVCVKIRSSCDKIPSAYRKKAFYFQLGLVQRYLLSCLIDADRYDTFLFEADKKPDREKGSPEFWEMLSGRLEKYLCLFPSETPIDQERRKISEQCLAFSSHAQGIFRLSVPTGSGKTMASLRYALNCAKANGKDRIFYIAPYKSILEQNAGDIREALNIDDDSIILEHHSDVVLDDEKSGEAARYTLLTQRWESPVILTTAVQFLNALFDGRTACVRRMHSLANSVIILDEFQALPVRCTDMVNAALDFLAYACNCAVILCTATQPEAEELPVPVISGTPGQMTDNLEETFAAFRRTRAVDKTSEGMLSAGQIADFSVSRLSSCDNLLLILNTKSAAKSLYLALKNRMDALSPAERVPIFYLSTSLCPQHRMDSIQKIRDSLSGKIPGGNRMICVSTQLIEAGVNLSFQCVVRSLAGLDSIAQAAGRCNRHGESPCRDVFVIRCADENLSHLPDIQKAQEAASHVLQDYRSNSAQFGDDFLSPKAVRRYYRYYFDLQKTQLAYPADEREDPKLFTATDLFDLLSVNTPARRFCAEHQASLPHHPMHQAYETAGKIFEAIESGGLDVIVPYGKGRELIQQFYSGPALGAIPKLLRQAQRYSVHLFDGEKNRLNESGAIDFLPESGVAVLRNEFYSGELGVQAQRAEMDPCIV